MNKIINNSILNYVALIFLLLSLFIYSSYAYSFGLTEDDDLAPGYKDCLATANRKYDGLYPEEYCVKEATKYWGNKLEIAYRKARHSCDKAQNQKLCHDKLKQMELAWLKYTDLMMELLANGGANQESNASNTLEAAVFGYNATRYQYEKIAQLADSD